MRSRLYIFFLAMFCVSGLGSAQTAASKPQESLGDAARRLRQEKNGQTDSSQAPSSSTTQNSSESLGDIARRIRDSKEPDVVVTDEDAQNLFKQIDTILKFASEDTGLPIHYRVKHKLVGRDEVDKKMAAALAEDDEAKKLQQSELVMKKFGVLPQNFQLRKFYEENAGHDLAGFYDFREKTMYLLNWIELQKQEPVMAHELTHALQDQNFNLMRWNGVHSSHATKEEDAIDTEARVAAVEGQAMVVFLDYLLRPTGRSLATVTNAIETLRSILLSADDSPVVFHNAPLLLKETTYFPYLDGFAFELEVMKREGTEAAFSGVFAHPPRDTHEIIHPDDYIARVRPAMFRLPDLSEALGPGYKSYDSGAIGELDVRIMVEVFGRQNDVYTVAANWNGGYYQAVIKPSATTKPEASLTPSDLGLVYVSRWKSYTAAKRFATLYESALLKRTKATGTTAPTECAAATCKSKWSAHFAAGDGPVTMEIATDNSLMITQGLEDATVTQIKSALAQKPHGGTRAEAGPELSLRFAALPEMEILREEVLESAIRRMAER